VRLDQLEPVAPEELAVVGDLPVTPQQSFPLGERELTQQLTVVVLIEVGVVLEPGRQVDNAGGSCCRVDEAGLDPGMATAAGVAGRPHPQRHIGQPRPVSCCETVGSLLASTRSFYAPVADDRVPPSHLAFLHGLMTNGVGDGWPMRAKVNAPRKRLHLSRHLSPAPSSIVPSGSKMIR
jgi:hypothetical protein